MVRTALVLGGGGALGIAWETGVLAGLQRAGVDVTDADLLVGTSAGSVVTTQIAQGHSLEELAMRHLEQQPDGIETNMDFDPQNVVATFQKWAAFREMDEAACAEVGLMALESRTVSEDQWVDWCGTVIDAGWPERDLRLTAVDAESGQFKAWSRDDGIDVRRAVASSCAVPGMFPCVSFNGRRYQDGGVRSGTSADLATGYDVVLVIAPIGAGPLSIEPLLGRQAKSEVDGLREAGSNAELIFPDSQSAEAIGPNRMDGSRRAVTVEAGIRQGTKLAERLERVWSKAPA